MVRAKLLESKHGVFSAVGAIVRASDDVNSQSSHADRYTWPKQTVQTKNSTMMKNRLLRKDPAVVGFAPKTWNTQDSNEANRSEARSKNPLVYLHGSVGSRLKTSNLLYFGSPIPYVFKCFF